MAATTGIKKLDTLLGGGFQEGSSVLIEGEPGSGKEAIAMHFLFANIEACKGYYMFYGPNVGQLVKKFSEYGMKLPSQNNITWFDTNNSSKGKNIINCSMDDLTTLALATSQFYEKNKGKKIAGVVAVLSPGLMKNDPVIIYRFLYDMIQKLKKYNSNAVFLLEEGMHTQDTVIAMEGLCDFVMQTKFMGDGRGFRIKKSIKPIKPGFHKFNITNTGVVMTK